MTISRPPSAATRAPLYVASYDLCRLVLEPVAALPDRDFALCGAPAADAARRLVVALAHALTFTERRGERIAAADAAVVELRIALRLLSDRGLASPGWHRLATGQLASIGRMIGGWRRFDTRDPPE